MLKFTVFLSILVFVTPVFANPYMIRNDVDLALRRMEYSGRHEFDVEVKGGTVTIDGFVSSAEDKVRVEKTAKSVNGVSFVKNNLTVVGASAISTSNTAKIIRDRIKADPGIKNYTLEVQHSGNKITLTGEVQEPGDKTKIFNIAYNVAPDANIINELEVKNKASLSDYEINEKVLSTLRAEGAVGLDTVSVNTKDGVVSFAGKVSNHKDIDRMLSITLMVEGVKSVRSDVVSGK